MRGRGLSGLRCVLAILAVAFFSPSPLAHAEIDIQPGDFLVVGEELSAAQNKDYTKRLSKALKRLKPQRAGVTDTYILSVAMWNDPVFVSEATQAASILSQRYDGEGRTIVLTVGTGEDLPESGLLAGPAFIQRALKGIGKRINPKEDLVIVFFTSHGAGSGEVGLMRQGDETVGAMTPLWLKNQLDAAGIATRFVIVSACYSGSFVPVFEDMDSAVFTAASADQPSFGCNADRDWTFFGDALFNYNLRGGSDFEIAQASAARLITEWETQEDFEPSLPQRHVGIRAGERIRDAEAYGRAVGCVADLWNNAKLSRPSEAGQAEVEQAMKRHHEQALYIGKRRGYSPAQVEQHLETARTLPDYGSGFTNVNQRASQCLKA